MQYTTDYFWVVICKNHRFHHKGNLSYEHRIALGETDAFSPLPMLTEQLKVRCDNCGEEYSSRPMCLAAVSGTVRHCRTPAKLARRCNRVDAGLRVISLQCMFLPHIGGGENCDERRWSCSLLHIGAALGLFALYQTHCAHHFESELARHFNRLNGRGACGAYVIDDHDPRALLAKPFDPLPGPVLLVGLTHQKAMQFSADHRDRNHNRISAHGQSADRLRLPLPSSDLLQKHLPGQLRSFCVKRSSAAIDVVVTGPARRKLELSETK